MLLVVVGVTIWGLDRPTPSEPPVSTVTAHRQFITQLAPYAMTLQRQTNVLASISLAQAILESDWGQSTLASREHNLYGVKASATQPGRRLQTLEYLDGHYVTVTARFATYPNWAASMKAHALLLAQGTAWNPQQYVSVLAATTYRQAARALSKSGYATDPHYAEKLITLIQRYHLAVYDQRARRSQSQ